MPAQIPTPKQSCLLSGERKTVAQRRTFSRGEDLALRYSQVALPFSPEHAGYLALHLTALDSLAFAEFQALAQRLDRNARDHGFTGLTVACVSFRLWAHWHTTGAVSLDPDLFAGSEELEAVLVDNTPPYALDGGELFFHIKALERNECETIARVILSNLEGKVDIGKSVCTIGDSIHAGRIYGGRMLHGLISSVEPVGFSARAIIGDEFPSHRGGCFALTQQFIHDWQQLSGMADNQLENLIGRDHFGNIITNDDKAAHIKMVRVNDEDGINFRHISQSQPFRARSQIVHEDARYEIRDKPRRPEIGPGKEEGVYQVSYTKTITALTRVLENMIGSDPGYIKCRHLNYSHADSGSFWYVPSAVELGLDAPHNELTVPMNAFFDTRSANGYMFYNSKDYLHHLGNRSPQVAQLSPQPSDRVVELLGYAFSRWHDTWYRRRQAPELGHLREHLRPGDPDLADLTLAERKGLATKRTLELLSSRGLGNQFDTYRIHPSELIVGAVPEFTLGSGFEAMDYMDEVERQNAFVLRLNEAGAAGHNVPNYRRAVAIGIGALVDDIKHRLGVATCQEARAFYESALLAYEGVVAYLCNYAHLAREKHEILPKSCAADRENLVDIATRMDKLASAPPETFLEAAQLVFSLHCTMHISGESVSIGRLDQILNPFYEADLAAGRITESQAQEVIDCFWIKMDEKVLLNHRHFNDRLSRGSGAITYAGGDFPQGAALNQWVQQVTVGGSKANDGVEPEDACNEVTRMCLRAARRLPLNAPCLSLKVSPRTPSWVFEEAAKVVLSGGGHPFLINDDKITSGLIESGRVNRSESIVEVADARDMVCDGCFESLIAGKSEFAFSYVPVPDAIEMALNRGRTYAAAGPVHITGLKASFRSAPPGEIKDFDSFYGIFLEHYRFKLIDFYTGMLGRYGNLNQVCPSPLLSPLIDGCLESGRDLTAGGARYKLVAPLMNGMACAIDALWAIRHLVFGDEAVLTLEELVRGLICDWGHDMKEPFYPASLGEDRIAVQAERFKHLRMYALSLPKFGSGHGDIDAFGTKVVGDLVELSFDLFYKPEGPILAGIERLKAKYSTPSIPFHWIITPGIATFEDYAGVGSFLGASADGRRNGQTVASDFSPSPTPSDLPVSGATFSALSSLRAWAPRAPEGSDPIGIGLSNGAPVDINIPEDYPLEELTKLITRFADGSIGPNMMSISCADRETLSQSQKIPECYDLVRLRMGGWSEFFVAMFPHHQAQHRRRPVFVSDDAAAGQAQVAE
jgi:pyruvate-formate lyase/deferrochelatase/peroxidase EfeB